MTTKDKNSSYFDVVILGGGPAGTSAGITLLKRDDISIAVLEKSDYTTSRTGESLTPGIRPLLEYLGVWEQFSKEQSLESYGSQATWGSSTIQSLDYMFTLHGAGWALDRVRFDRMLARFFSDRGGSLLKNHQVTSCKYSPTYGWKIQIKENNGIEGELHCKHLIDATGRRSFLARRMNIDRTVHDQLIGVTCIGQFTSPATVESVTQVEACDYGWWYTSPVPGNKIAVVLMTDSDIAKKLSVANKEKWLLLLEKTKVTRQRVAEADFFEQTRVFPCFSSCLKIVGGQGWVTVGDAVASHDPLSSSGIPHAIGSGVQGALVVADSLFAKGGMLAGYQESIHADFHQYQKTHWQYYKKETRWPESLFWKRRTRQVYINPLAVFESTGTLVDINKINKFYFSSRMLSELYSYCQPGKPAYQIVRELLHRHPDIPDQHIILELQALVESGHVKIAETAYTSGDQV